MKSCLNFRIIVLVHLFDKNILSSIPKYGLDFPRENLLQHHFQKIIFDYLTSLQMDNLGFLSHIYFGTISLYAPIFGF